MGPEAANNTAKLFGCLRDVFAANVVRVMQDELLDFILQDSNFRHRQSNFILSISRPNQRPIEGF